jgi:flagellar motor component MotA
MKVILGFIVITLGFAFSLDHLNQSVSQYWDAIAFFMVFFGTLSVAVMTSPSLKVGNIFKFLMRSLFAGKSLREDTVKNSLNVLKGRIPTGEPSRIDQRILLDGFELLRLGYSADKIREILSNRIYYYIQDASSVAQWIRGLSKYPPAFGLAGTVLGLIHLMKGLSEGADPKETGVRMAVALVATFYGIIVANVVTNPIGDKLLNNAKEDQNLAEISLATIVMIAEKTDYLTAIEQLNNYMPNKFKQLDFNQVMMDAS